MTLKFLEKSNSETKKEWWLLELGGSSEGEVLISKYRISVWNDEFWKERS